MNLPVNGSDERCMAMQYYKCVGWPLFGG